MLPISLVFSGVSKLCHAIHRDRLSKTLLYPKVGLYLSYALVPAASDIFIKAGLFGIDLNKARFV